MDESDDEGPPPLEEDGPQGPHMAQEFEHDFQANANHLLHLMQGGAQQARHERQRRVIGRAMRGQEPTADGFPPVYIAGAFHVCFHRPVKCREPGCMAQGHDTHCWPDDHKDDELDCVHMVMVRRRRFERGRRSGLLTRTDADRMWLQVRRKPSIKGTVIEQWRRPQPGTWTTEVVQVCLSCAMHYNNHERFLTARYWIIMHTIVWNASKDDDPKRFLELTRGTGGASTEMEDEIEKPCLIWKIPDLVAWMIFDYLDEEDPSWEQLEPCAACLGGIGTLEPCAAYHDFKHHMDPTLTCPVLREVQRLAEFDRGTLNEHGARRLRDRFDVRPERRGTYDQRWRPARPEDLPGMVQVGQGEVQVDPAGNAQIRQGGGVFQALNGVNYGNYVALDGMQRDWAIPEAARQHLRNVRQHAQQQADDIENAWTDINDFYAQFELQDAQDEEE